MNYNKKFFFDDPRGDELKIHKEPVSVLGGAAMLLVAAACFLFLSFSDFRFVFITLGSLPVFLLGLWDDLKWKHISLRKPYLKFLFLILSSLVSAGFLYCAGVKFYLLAQAGFFLAFLYIFALINAVNYQDGMDGQAGILVLISLLGFYALSVFSGNNFSAIISLIFAGSVFGFLIFNFPPARIFMGDSGAYLLGFALAVLAIIFSKNILNIFAVILILGVPLFDGIYSNARRFFSGKSIFLGDREHFYDKMVKRGFSIKKTLLISAVVQTIFVIIGLTIFIYSQG